MMSDQSPSRKLRALTLWQPWATIDPAHMTRFGVVRVEVLSIEQYRPVASSDIRDLLSRVRALPRLSASLNAEIDVVLARAAHG